MCITSCSSLRYHLRNEFLYSASAQLTPFLHFLFWPLGKCRWRLGNILLTLQSTFLSTASWSCIHDRDCLLKADGKSRLFILHLGNRLPYRLFINVALGNPVMTQAQAIKTNRLNCRKNIIQKVWAASNGRLGGDCVSSLELCLSPPRMRSGIRPFFVRLLFSFALLLAFNTSQKFCTANNGLHFGCLARSGGLHQFSWERARPGEGGGGGGWRGGHNVYSVDGEMFLKTPSTL